MSQSMQYPSIITDGSVTFRYGLSTQQLRQYARPKGSVDFSGNAVLTPVSENFPNHNRTFRSSGRGSIHIDYTLDALRSQYRDGSPDKPYCV